MTFLLFPGRHLLNTAYQERYLRRLVQVPLDRLDFLDGQRPATHEPIDQIIFAITSANQEHSRYNPIPLYVRAIGVDRFARPLENAFGVRYRIIGIPHYRPTERFAEYTLKEIAEQTEGNLVLRPDNCVVLCSTPAVIEMYRRLGFAILPAEYGEAAPQPMVPTAVLQYFATVGEGWATDGRLRDTLATSTLDLWQDFPDIPRRILRLWHDPLLNEEGSLTDERDYAAYAFGMGNQEIIELKYNDIQQALVPGKIVDEGCADGALLVRIARDFPDSDLIGIEITGEFMARARERQRAGHFGGCYVHFHQRNITQKIFQPGTIDATICNSTVHELWSYGDQEQTVRQYFDHKFEQTRPGGRLIIRDVVGPAHKDMEVVMGLRSDDGRNDDVFRECGPGGELAKHLASLSTYARFLRFARDFLAGQRQHRPHCPVITFRDLEPPYPPGPAGMRYVALSLKDAVEFMSKKDYTDNWGSEMHEEFAFWDFEEWKGALAAAGFCILEDPNEPERGSRIYTNPWIVENRWRDVVSLYRQVGAQYESLPYPPTNIVLVGEKRVQS